MTDNASANQLKQYIERLENLEEERKGIADDIRDVLSEAKTTGFDTKTLKKLIELRRMDPMARQEAEALLETYRAAIGLDGGAGEEPAETHQMLTARAHILEALMKLGEATVIQVKATLADKAAKALTYAQIGVQLDALVASGLAIATTGAGPLMLYQAARA